MNNASVQQRPVRSGLVSLCVVVRTDQSHHATQQEKAILHYPHLGNMGIGTCIHVYASPV